MWGLATAKAAEVKVRDDVLQRGFAYLETQMKDEDNLQLLDVDGARAFDARQNERRFAKSRQRTPL